MKRKTAHRIACIICFISFVSVFVICMLMNHETISFTLAIKLGIIDTIILAVSDHYAKKYEREEIVIEWDEF